LEARRQTQLREEAEEAKRKAKKADEEAVQRFHQYFGLTIGTLGGIAFAGLVLVVQKRSEFHNFEEILILLGGAIVLAMFSALFATLAGSGTIHPDNPVAWLGFALGGISFGCLMFGVLTVVLDANAFAGWIVAAIIFLACVAYLRAPTLAKWVRKALTALKRTRP
jgi:drug/metabolite transporter (DMT)-like permease